MPKEFTSLDAVKRLARKDATFFTKLLEAANEGVDSLQEVVVQWFGLPLHAADAQGVVDILTSRTDFVTIITDPTRSIYFW